MTMKQFDKRNLTMVMDFYELTMSNGYFREQDRDIRVAFDVFTAKTRMEADIPFLRDWSRS